MLRVLRRSRSPLLILLFSTYMGFSGCVTGSQPEEDVDEMESSQNEDLENDSADLEELTIDDEAPAAASEETKTTEEVTPETAPLAELVPILPQTSGQDSGAYVGGKAGDAIADGLPETGSKMAYLVQKGDTLSKIAKRVFGDMKRWRELAANSSVKNPHLIYPGDVVFYQLDQTTLAFAKKYELLERKLTPVREGETLSEVSKRIYGDKDQWKFLWRHNDQINDPTDLTVGSVVYYVSPNALDSLSDVDYAKTTIKSQYKMTNKKVSKHSKKAKA